MVLSKYSIIFCKDCERGGSLIEDKDFGRDIKWKKKKKGFSMVILCFIKSNGDIVFRSLPFLWRTILEVLNFL